jgi:hypothetical protein
MKRISGISLPFLSDPAASGIENDWPTRAHHLAAIVLPEYHTYYDDNPFFSGRVIQSLKIHLPHDFDQNG